MSRCKNGTHKNKKTKECEPIVRPSPTTATTHIKKRCKNGTHKNKKTKECEPVVAVGVIHKPTPPTTTPTTQMKITAFMPDLIIHTRKKKPKYKDTTTQMKITNFLKPTTKP